MILSHWRLEYVLTSVAQISIFMIIVDFGTSIILYWYGPEMIGFAHRHQQHAPLDSQPLAFEGPCKGFIKRNNIYNYTS